MISASGDAAQYTYKLLYGASGKRWVVATHGAAAENIYKEGGRGSQGMAGRTLRFNLEDGTTVDFTGPWKTGAGGLHADTGYDVRGMLRCRGIVALSAKRRVQLQSTYWDILYYDEEPVLSDPDYIKEIAQAYADTLGVPVWRAYMTQAGGMSGQVKPSLGFPNEGRAYDAPIF